jgi:hypothetical protein
MKAATAPILAFTSLMAACGAAFAHASDRGYVLLLPTGYYLAGGALAVGASFLVLTVLPPASLKRLAAQRLPLFCTGTGRPELVSLLSFLVMGVLVAAGFLGSRDPLSNPLPLTVWTLIWVGVTLVQGLVGNVWTWINPWYGPVWLVGKMRGRSPDAGDDRVPTVAGYWPAALLFFGFAWFELIYPAPDDPARLALAVTLYWTGNFACMLMFGYAGWSARGECLSVFFGMVARLSILEFAAGPAGGRSELTLCFPGAKLAKVDPLPLSGVLFLLIVLGSVSFDGFSKTFFWLGANGINPLEFPGRSALMMVNTAGLLLTVGVLATAFAAAVLAGERLAAGTNAIAASAGLLVWSIVPIALAYHFAHYLTSLVGNGQYALVALSDPFSRGWNLFGTAAMPVAPGVVAGARSAWVLWNLQASAIVAGHVLAVLIAHLLASRLHTASGRAIASQAPLAMLMVLYTVFGLWLLSTPAVG